MAERDLIDAVHDEVYQLLVRHGVEDLAALTDAGRLCDTIQRRFGGGEHYVPVPDKIARNARIAAELRAGADPKTVAARHGVSPKTITRAARTVSGESDEGGFGTPDWLIK